MLWFQLFLLAKLNQFPRSPQLCLPLVTVLALAFQLRQGYM